MIKTLGLLIAICLLLFTTPAYAQQPTPPPAPVWWSSLSEIKDYVKAQDTYMKRYTPNAYDCENFAFDLWWQARQDGHVIGIREVIKENNHQVYYHHVQNFTIMGNPFETNARLVVVEARTARVHYLYDEFEVRLD